MVGLVMSRQRRHMQLALGVKQRHAFFTARQQQGLHIAALAALIKVSQRKLELLEADRLSELPDATFARALAQTMCRSLKIPARYISGYLYNGPAENLKGAQASHAWVEVIRHQNQAGKALDDGQQIVELVCQATQQLLMEAFAMLIAELEMGGEDELHET